MAEKNGAFGPDKIVNVHLCEGNFPLCGRLLGMGQDEPAHAVAVPGNPGTILDKEPLWR